MADFIMLGMAGKLLIFAEYNSEAIQRETPIFLKDGQLMIQYVAVTGRKRTLFHF